MDRKKLKTNLKIGVLFLAGFFIFASFASSLEKNYISLQVKT